MNEEAQNELSNEISSDIENKQTKNRKVIIDKNNPLIEYHDGLIVIKSKYKNARAIICID